MNDRSVSFFTGDFFVVLFAWAGWWNSLAFGKGLKIELSSCKLRWRTVIPFAWIMRWWNSLLVGKGMETGLSSCKLQSTVVPFAGTGGWSLALWKDIEMQLLCSKCWIDVAPVALELLHHGGLSLFRTMRWGCRNGGSHCHAHEGNCETQR